MRIRPVARGPRAGITLTEILISIMIMGVGMLALATLFPLGLARLRDAARASPIGHADRDGDERDVVARPAVQGELPGQRLPIYDPFTEDPAPGGEVGAIVSGLDRVSVSAGLQGPERHQAAAPGIPVCYDPLWWYQVYVDSGGTVQPSLTPGGDFRFGSGIGHPRNDPVNGGPPSAYGLQRLTNFPLIQRRQLGGPIDPASLFASPDDLVMQTDGTPSPSQGRGSPIVPDLSTNARQYDYSYTWMFTGKQTDVTNGTIFDGDMVIFHNRPFAQEQVAFRPEHGGWRDGGRGDLGLQRPRSSTATAATRTSLNVLLLLRRPASARPRRPRGRLDRRRDLRAVQRQRGSALLPARRATAPTRPSGATGTAWSRRASVTTRTTIYPGCREMIVTLGSDLRAKTQVVPARTGATPVVMNAALVSPYGRERGVSRVYTR